MTSKFCSSAQCWAMVYLAVNLPRHWIGNQENRLGKHAVSQSPLAICEREGFSRSLRIDQELQASNRKTSNRIEPFATFWYFLPSCNAGHVIQAQSWGNLMIGASSMLSCWTVSSTAAPSPSGLKVISVHLIVVIGGNGLSRRQSHSIHRAALLLLLVCDDWSVLTP